MYPQVVTFLTALFYFWQTYVEYKVLYTLYLKCKDQELKPNYARKYFKFKKI